MNRPALGRPGKSIRRIQTTNFDKHDPMNQTGQSTMLDARESIHHGISVNNDNPKLKRSPSGLSMGKRSARGAASMMSGVIHH